MINNKTTNSTKTSGQKNYSAKLDSLREILSIPITGKKFLVESEINEILVAINPGFIRGELSLNGVLESAIPGWTKQDTANNHPINDNINNIVNLLKSNKKTMKKTNSRSHNAHALKIRQLIEFNGYSDPATDSDRRVRKAWDEIKHTGLEFSMNHDFLGTLAPHTNLDFAITQSRATSEDRDKIVDLFHAFYQEGEKMQKPPIGIWLLDENGNKKLFLCFGNHRGRSHSYAQKAGYESIGCVLIFGNDLSLEDRKQLAFRLSVISNEDTVDMTKKETDDDIIHQMKTATNLELAKDPTGPLSTEEGQMAYGEKFLIDFKPNYSKPRFKTKRRALVSLAFSSNNGQVIPASDAEDDSLTLTWQQFFPKAFWDPKQEGLVKQWRINDNDTAFGSRVLRFWDKQPDTERVSKSVWLTVRIGENGRPPTSIKSIQSRQRKFLKKLKQNNKSKRRMSAGFPIIDRVI